MTENHNLLKKISQNSESRSLSLETDLEGNGGKDTPPNSSSDTNGNSTSGAVSELLKPLIKYGQLLGALSYGILTTFNGKRNEYVTRQRRFSGILSLLLYSIICLHLAAIVAKFNFNVSFSKLVNMIKRVTYGVFVVKLVIVYWSLHSRGRDKGLFVKILKQADHLQEKCALFGISFPRRRTIRRVSIAICFVSIILGLFHVFVFSVSHCLELSNHWYEGFSMKFFNTFTLGFGDTKAMVAGLPTPFAIIFGSFGFLLDIFCWNLWYFVDAFRLLTALIMWTFYRKLNKALENGKVGIENLPDVMNLHFNGTKLMNHLNELMGPITLASTVFNLLYVCFWTNFCLINVEFKLPYIIGIITFLRMVFVFCCVAEVNAEAYQISRWLENSFTDLEHLPKFQSEKEQAKFTFFTTLLYNREAIGFKGLHFFTCTPALNIAIGGLVMTYTVVVNQVATQ